MIYWINPVNQVNEGVREKENSDRLEWIQNHVQCDGAAEVFNLLINKSCSLFIDSISIS